MKRLPVVALPIGLAIIISAGRLGIAGNLNPPAGPVAPTMKNLLDVEPRSTIRNSAVPIVISVPGSYYLAENIESLPGHHGIEIAASNVTLDLNGFSVIADRVSSLDGILVGGHTSIQLRNGVVRDCSGDGIDAAAATSVEIRDIAAYNNGSISSTGGPGGFSLRAGRYSVVANCRVALARGVGIRVGVSSIVRGCVVAECAEEGVVALWGATIDGCSILESQSAGISTTEGCIVTRCTITGGGDDGIVVGYNSTVAHCAVESGAGNGIITGDASTVTESSVRNCSDNGILVGAGSRVRNCAAVGNGGSGVVILGFGSASGVTAYDNALDGIFCFAPGNTVSDCTSTNNGGSGVTALDSLVIGCTLIDNADFNISGGGNTSIHNHTDGP